MLALLGRIALPPPTCDHAPPPCQNPATRAQAEAALLDFRRSGSVEAAVGLLQAAGEEGVQFQAVLALREIVLGRWAVVGRPAAQATLSFLLDLALGRLAADPRPLLRTQARRRRRWLCSRLRLCCCRCRPCRRLRRLRRCHSLPAVAQSCTTHHSPVALQVNATAAALIKRGWLDSEPAERDATLQVGPAGQARRAAGVHCAAVFCGRPPASTAAPRPPRLPQAIHSQAAALGSAEARRAGLELLASIVEEFSPCTASQMGLSWCVGGCGVAGNGGGWDTDRDNHRPALGGGWT